MASETELRTDSNTNGEARIDFSGASHWTLFGIFVLATLLYSWGLWALLVFNLVPSSATTPLILLGGFGPVVGALVTLSLTGWSIRKWLRSNLLVRIPLRWYALAIGLPPVLIIGSSIIYVSAFNATYAFEEMVALWMFLLGLVLTFFVGGGNEELGWRGIAQPALQEGLSAFMASLAIGLVWFIWHVPLFFVPGSSQAGVPMVPYALGVLATAVVLSWLYNATGSVLIPWLYHASVNPASGYYLAGVAELKTVPGYSSYALIVTILAIVLVIRYGPSDLAPRAKVRLSDLR